MVEATGGKKSSVIQGLMDRLRPMDYLVIFAMLITSLATTLAGTIKKPWPFAVVTYIVAVIFVTSSILLKDVRFQRLLVFGLVTGVVELLTDWYHVIVFKSLVYLDHSFFSILASPEYMPLGWMNVIVQMSYIGLRLREEFDWSIPGTMVVIGILGALNIPYYEEMAFSAGAWYYTASWMIGHTPIWVVAAYFVEIPWVVPIIAKIEKVLEDRDANHPLFVLLLLVMGGILMGIVIFIGGFVTYSSFSDYPF